MIWGVCRIPVCSYVGVSTVEANQRILDSGVFVRRKVPSPISNESTVFASGALD